ncbi:sensor histidine kinase [Kitasatospora sp. NPDC052896]|uniref:sensor histidine kinase n=1 Tax=Kitasatospora sp. NPDC052896 TaxID=3364061 RepID=UPI0037C83AFF
MTARSRLFGRPATLPVVLAAVVVAAGAACAAAAAAPSADRGAVGAWAALAALACCLPAAVAVAQRARIHRLTVELDRSRAQVESERAAVRRAEADTTAALTEARNSRARANTARTDAEAARVELLAARADTVEARSEAAAARAAADDERAELARLARETIPEVVGRLRAGASVETVLVDHRQTAHEDLLELLAREVAHGERQRAAALAVCATAAGRVQALATSMHAELREMQHQHGEEVLGDLLRLDHSTAQAGRLADSIAVLTGARSGRRWGRPIPVESVLRGALGRIGAYQRIRLHSASTAAVAGYAAEGVMHALAELLDNAANFSAPPAEVHVYVEELNAGLAITVEDSGLGLSEMWQRRAEQAVSGEPLDLTTLSAGTRLGFAVVGALARKHGLSISFRPSARGGTGVVMLVPVQLVTRPAPAPPEPSRTAALPATPPAALTAAPSPALPGTSPAALPAAPAPVRSDGGLPQRRRGQTLAAAAHAAAVMSDPRPRLSETATRFGAFRQAVRGPQPDQSRPAQPTPTPPRPAPTADFPKDDA